MKLTHNILVWTILILGLVGLTIGVRGIFLGMPGVPILDAWYIYDQISDQGFSLYLGWLPYEDHRPIVPTILVQGALMFSEFWAWSAYFPQLISLAAVLVLFATIFYTVLKFESRNRLEIFALFILVLFTAFHPFHIASLLAVFRTWVALSLFFSVFSSICFYLAYCSSVEQRRPLYFLASLTLAILASATGASGLLVWGVILLVAIALRINFKHLIAIIVVAVSTVVAFRTRSDIGFVEDGGLAWIFHPFDYLLELTYFFGSVIGRGLFIQPFSEYSIAASIVVGTVVLAASLTFVIRSLLNERELDLSSIGLFSVVTFGLGWGSIYILKHGAVPPNPPNWIAAGDYGLVVFPMVICLIVHVYLKLRSRGLKYFLFLLVGVLYLVTMPSHLVNWELAKVEKFNWEFGLAQSISKFARSANLKSVPHPHYRPATVNRATLAMLLEHKFPPFSDRRVRAVFTGKSIEAGGENLASCFPRLKGTFKYKPDGQKIMVPGSEVPFDSMPMIIERDGKLVGYGVLHEALSLKLNSSGRNTDVRNWVIPTANSTNTDQYSIVLVSSDLSSVCKLNS